jgi:acetyl/propionyl-CoA carboxylase alpha subunit/acetyl-CoA carboxylase carboxyltransferase component
MTPPAEEQQLTPFHRIAIINRGEPAMRLLHAARELAGVETVALYTEPDRHARFVRAADHAVALGAPTFVDPRDGRRRSSYLDYERLERALVDSGADAAWVGWGFVAEHAEFAELCRRLGVTFIGPSPEAMRRLGDKITAKLLAEAERVPIAPWSGGPIEDRDALLAHAARLGFPLMVKATAGGGGRGIRQVNSESELIPAFESARAEAVAAFGDATVFLEKRVAAARHIEVQIVGDHHGAMWALGVRDCTLQRRHQKVLEESPSPVLSVDEDRELRAASARLARAAGYTNAGTVEYLFDPVTRAFSFMEVNARLQVEHPVTELVTGVDLVKLQIHVAAGGHLEGEPPPERGCAIEVRLCAEDPDAGFAPAPGHVEQLRVPTGPGVRVDTGIAEGDDVPPDFDSMIAKLVVWGRDRAEALRRVRNAVAETAIVVRGGATNKAFLLALLDRPEVASGDYDNTWLDRLAAAGEHVARAHLEVALLAAAVEVYEEEHAGEHLRFVASAARGRPRLDSAVGRTVELAFRGGSQRFAVRSIGDGRYRVSPAGGPAIDVESERFGDFERRVSCLGGSHRVLAVAQGLEHLVEVDGIPHRIARDPGGVVRAPMPAIVLAVAVKPGDMVAVGDRLVTLEAMKTEMSISSPIAGRVREVPIMANVQVDAGATLVMLDPHEDGPAEEAPAAHLVFTAAADDGPPRWRRAAAELRAFFLGFDVSADEARALAAAMTSAGPGDPDVLAAEDDLLAAFADVHWLFRRRPQRDGVVPERRSPQEHLLHYVKAIEDAGEGLPAAFLEHLDRALVHYGVRDRARSPAVEAALLRIWKSHERVEEQLASVESILEWRLAHKDELHGRAEPRLRRLLDRLIAVGQGRYSRLADLAREVRFHYFEQPEFEAARRATYAELERSFVRYTTSSDPEERAVLLDQLVECPYPLAGLLAGRVAAADRAARGSILSVMMRRYYRVRGIHDVEIVDGSDSACLRGDYEHDEHPRRLIAVVSPWDEVAAALKTVAAEARQAPPGRDVVVELYTWLRATARDPDALARAAREVLNAAALPRGPRRVALTVVGLTANGDPRAIHYFTFRPSQGGGYEEDPLYRGLHPKMGTRLHLWRLREFQLERLPSLEHVYLFHGVSRSNPKDERLFALVEVRDVTPVRDEAGRVVQLPYFERMLHEALTSIRHVQAQRPASRRLEWNRVLLYVWQPLLLNPSEIEDLAYRMGALTEDLGLEQVVVRGRIPDETTGELTDTLLRISSDGGRQLLLTYDVPTERALTRISEYDQKVVQCRRRGLTYPYELVKLLAHGDRPGEFVELDIDESGELAPVSRPPGGNTSNVIVGLTRNFTVSHPDGMERVALFGDPTKEMGALAEPECRRILLALSLAERRAIPVEWFALSAGARISMQSGTENMDWIARVLRSIVDLTQRGGEINVVVCGINVGAQPYWNAEATMLMHTRGILIMTPDSAMVLTGKQALDYSGSVSAEDNLGIGGYERIMGPNGQAQYLAGGLQDACRILLAHYEHTYRARGERFPRRAPTVDPFDRDVRVAPQGGEGGFATVGEVFSDANRGRKRPFAIRPIMAAVIDHDRAPLERWADMQGAEIAVVWDAHLGGRPLCVIGIESQPLPRLGFVPADGPDQWAGGTLFPRGARKVARAINAASGVQPLVVLANLSGFDGSPESMRNLQLEYGAEIGRAVVNFDGPIVFCVVSRYHGGAFVVFSRALNANLEGLAVEGAHASVIGGAPAAAVVFAREVAERTRKDPRVHALEQTISASPRSEQGALRGRLVDVSAEVRSEKLGELADEFDRVHSVARALDVGSLDRIIAAKDLRPALIEAIERGIARCTTSPS